MSVARSDRSVKPSSAAPRPSAHRQQVAAPAPVAVRHPGGRGPVDVLALQGYAGNRAVSGYLDVARQATPPAAAPAVAAPLPAPAAPDVDWIESLDEHVKSQIDTFAAEQFDRATGAKRDRLVTRRQENRVTFVRTMAPLLGGEAAVQAHFEAVKPMDGTHLWAHASVRDRLSQVKADLEARGTPMPATGTGLGLRGRHLHPKGVGMMMHPLGFAVDWKAYAAPHIKDRRLHTLFETVTGGPPAFHLSVGGKRLGTQARWDLIEQLGRGTADPERAAQLMASIESEYRRLAKASTDFKTSLPESSLTALREVERLRTAVTTAEKALKRAGRTAKPAAAEALSTARAAFEAGKARVREQLETLLAPWLTELDARVAAVVAAAAARGVDLRAEVTTDEYLAQLSKDVAQLGRAAAKPERTARALLDGARRTHHEVGVEIAAIEAHLADGSTEREALLATARPLLGQASGLVDALAALLPPVPARPGTARPRRRSASEWTRILARAGDRLAGQRAGYDAIAGGLRTLQERRTARTADLARRRAGNAAVAARLGRSGLADLQEQRKRLFWLEETARALRTDIAFVVAADRAVADPGITQLLGLTSGTEGGGFFTPDAETGGADEAAKGRWSGSHGFNLEFFKSMVRHGFELAVAWEDTPDTMHFELVEGRRFASSGGTRAMSAGADAP